MPRRVPAGQCPYPETGSDRERLVVPRALVSVSDKRGIVAFVQGLRDLGWEIVSTGGTAAALRAGGIEGKISVSH